MPRRSEHESSFIKDWVRLSDSGRYDMARIKEVMALLVANDGPLAAEWCDHELNGKWADHRECHIGGDWLLIYRLSGSKSKSEVIFVRTGTHAELFG
jgi:mRNA interferase YafQ